MTPSERKALLFLATVGVLGAGARVAATPARADTAESRAALDRQLDAVDSARAADADRRRTRATGTRTRAPRERSAATAPVGTPGAPPIAVEPPPTAPAAPVDVDVADVEALDALPGIGPALARRIVEERERGGAFGSPAGLVRVRGVGPKTAARLAPHVTFSGIPRPSHAAARRPP